VNDDVTDLSSNYLSQFKSNIEQYDGWAIRVKAQHETIDVQGESAAFCIHMEEVGISCAAVEAKSGSSTDTKTTYWLPTSKKADLDANTLDLVDGSNDSNKVEGSLKGLRHYVIGTSGASSFVADKL